jgi:hypothetical protein
MASPSMSFPDPFPEMRESQRCDRENCAMVARIIRALDAAVNLKGDV